MNTSHLSNRTLSAFAVSVGTSLALESIFEASSPSIDPERVIPQKVTILDYNEFWLNLSTLFRNIIGSLTKEGAASVFPGELADVLEGEAEMIQFITSQQSSSRVKTIFYACNYQDLELKYPHARIRKDATENQQVYRRLHNQTLQIVLSRNLGSNSYKHFKDRPEPSGRPKALVMTHMAYDLLSVKEFSELHLIESHTGILKKPATWYTKYNDGKNLPMVPFNAGLLQVFGDKETFAIPDIKLKREVIELAKQCRWTPVTTRDKLIFDADKLKPQQAEVLKLMLRQ